jgi:ABC-type dipeptide/oligopeptide/nickel transport system ATPase component
VVVVVAQHAHRFCAVGGLAVPLQTRMPSLLSAWCRKLSRREARTRALSALERAGLGDATSQGDAYPEELSRGVLQEVLVAMALAVEPTLLIADDPATALDALERVRVLELLTRSARDRDAALLLMSKDPRTIADLAEHVVVLDGGLIVERGAANALFKAPSHELTRRWIATAQDPVEAGIASMEAL